MSPLFLVPSSVDEWQTWLSDEAPKLGGVLVVVIAVKLLSRPIIGRVLRGAGRSTAVISGEDPVHVDRRVRTLEGTLSWLLTFIAGFIGLAVGLDALGLNIAPVVAGVGVVGIAIGLGAQTLIKDVLNGVFILVEDQYSVGDQVTVAGITGEVLEINPRRTLVRDGDGNIHTVPNSTITTATNRTPGLRRLHIEIDVAFRDVEEATRLVDAVAGEVAEAHGAPVVRRPRVQSYSVIGDGDVRVHIVGEVRAETRWQVEAELLRRLKRRFEDQRLEASFPAAER